MKLTIKKSGDKFHAHGVSDTDEDFTKCPFCDDKQVQAACLPGETRYVVKCHNCETELPGIPFESGSRFFNDESSLKEAHKAALNSAVALWNYQPARLNAEKIFHEYHRLRTQYEAPGTLSVIIRVPTNKEEIYQAARRELGYDRQMCAVAEYAGLAASEACKIINHKSGERGLAEAIAGLEIAIEQLRYNGLAQMIEHFKLGKMMQLAKQLNIEADCKYEPYSTD